MRLFCVFSSICFDILDDDGSLIMPYSSGEYFIHYVGYNNDRFDTKLDTKEGYLKGTSHDVLAQLEIQGKIPAEEQKFYLDLNDEVSLIATMKVQLMGQNFIHAILAYAKGIEDKELSELITSKAEHIFKKTRFEYSTVDSPFDCPEVQVKVT